MILIKHTGPGNDPWFAGIDSDFDDQEQIIFTLKESVLRERVLQPVDMFFEYHDVRYKRKDQSDSIPNTQKQRKFINRRLYGNVDETGWSDEPLEYYWRRLGYKTVRLPSDPTERYALARKLNKEADKFEQRLEEKMFCKLTNEEKRIVLMERRRSAFRGLPNDGDDISEIFPEFSAGKEFLINRPGDEFRRSFISNGVQYKLWHSGTHDPAIIFTGRDGREMRLHPKHALPIRS